MAVNFFKGLDKELAQKLCEGKLPEHINKIHGGTSAFWVFVFFFAPIVASLRRKGLSNDDILNILIHLHSRPITVYRVVKPFEYGGFKFEKGKHFEVLRAVDSKHVFMVEYFIDKNTSKEFIVDRKEFQRFVAHSKKISTSAHSPLYKKVYQWQGKNS